jgi:hypothetical protein
MTLGKERMHRKTLPSMQKNGFRVYIIKPNRLIFRYVLILLFTIKLQVKNIIIVLFDSLKTKINVHYTKDSGRTL